MCIFEQTTHGTFSKITFADPLMNHEDDMKLIENYYQCPKEDYYNQKLHGKRISRYVSNKNKRRDKEDFLLKSSKTKFPKTICEEDAIATIGESRTSSTSNNKNIKKLDAITKFGLFFLQNKFKNSTFIAHNR